MRDIAGAQPEIVAKMTAPYDAWFASAQRVRQFDPDRTTVGTSPSTP